MDEDKMAETTAPERSLRPLGARKATRASLMFASVAWLAVGCAESPVTIAMHDPIYPAPGQQVTYTLESVSPSKLLSVTLYATVEQTDAAGAVVSATGETLLQTWVSPESGVEFRYDRGYAARSLVRYKFKVRARSGLWPRTETFTQEVAFTIRPRDSGPGGQFLGQPDPTQVKPAPVYVTGDPDAAFDIVLIPDEDIPDSEMDTFRVQCRRMIREAFLDEPTIQILRHSLNFYINPYPGSSVDYDQRETLGDHRMPVNYAALDFAEGRILMHERILQDYTPYNLRVCSTEMGNRGTVLHESGHALFGLADEYPQGSHWPAIPLRNNWSAGAKARADACCRGKWWWDARPITDTPWWKLCATSCQMDTTGEHHTAYDRPCQDRIVWSVLDCARSQAE